MFTSISVDHRCSLFIPVVVVIVVVVVVVVVVVIVVVVLVVVVVEVVIVVVVVEMFIYSRKLIWLISPLQEHQLKILKREILIQKISKNRKKRESEERLGRL